MSNFYYKANGDYISKYDVERFSNSGQKYKLVSHEKNKQTSSCPAGQSITNIQECMDAAKELGLRQACDGSKSDCGATGWNGKIPCLYDGNSTYPYYRSRGDGEQELCKNEKFSDSQSAEAPLGGCADCADGYKTVTQNGVQSCVAYPLKCDNGQALPQNKAKDREFNCDTCNSGYHNVNGECVPYTATCEFGEPLEQSKRTADGSNCDPRKCMSEYHYENKNGSCIPCNEMCGPGNTKEVTQCTSSSNRECDKCERPENSKFITDTGCEWSCNNGYYKEGDLCKPYQAKCDFGDAYNQDMRSDNGPNCVTCKDGYYMTNSSANKQTSDNAIIQQARRANERFSNTGLLELFANYKDQSLDKYMHLIPKQTMDILISHYQSFFQNLTSNFEREDIMKMFRVDPTPCLPKPLGTDNKSECKEATQNLLETKDKSGKKTALEYLLQLNEKVKETLVHFLNVDPTNQCVECTPCENRTQTKKQCSQYGDTQCEPCVLPSGAEWTNQINNDEPDNQKREKSNCTWNCKVDYKLSASEDKCVDWEATCQNGTPNGPRERTADGPNCKTCNEGFYLVNGDCVPCNAECGPENTKQKTACTTDSNRECEACPLPENATFNSNQGCVYSCNPGYYLGDDGSCIAYTATCSNGNAIQQSDRTEDGSNCGTCNEGYYLNSENKTCNLCTATCTGNTEETTQCTATTNRVCSDCPTPPSNASFAPVPDGQSSCAWLCNTGYYREGDSCVKCTNCDTESGNKFTEQTCSSTEDAQCANCELPQNAVFDKETECSWSCQSDYYRDGDQCNTCTNCDQVSGNKKTEQACSGSANSVCTDCTKDPNSTFDSELGCSYTCNPGYIRNGDTCDLIEKTCSNGTVLPISERTETGPNCTESGCNDGYYYLNGDCVACTTCSGNTEENTACSSSQNRTCKDCIKPDNASFTNDDGCGWECNENYSEKDGKCHPNDGATCTGDDKCASGVCKGGHCCKAGSNGVDPLCGKCNGPTSAYPGHCNQCINHGQDNIWNKDRQPNPIAGKGNWDCVAKPVINQTSSGIQCLPWKTAQGGRQAWYAKSDTDNTCGDPDGSGFDWCYIPTQSNGQYWQQCQGSADK